MRVFRLPSTYFGTKTPLPQSLTHTERWLGNQGQFVETLNLSAQDLIDRLPDEIESFTVTPNVDEVSLTIELKPGSLQWLQHLDKNENGKGRKIVEHWLSDTVNLAKNLL